MNTLYFENNLRPLYQIRPVSVAQYRQEQLWILSEYNFRFFLTKN
jgi:hypothetical protein